ncbi:MAG: C40 family peptidase [Thermoanaerobaculia bacterium]|nr:C40 family peptidase [Thermoanaerobaculia bacterium]
MRSARTAFLLLLPFIAFASLLISGCSTAKKTVTPPPDTSGLSQKKFRQEVVNYALQYIGSSYKSAGTNPKTGFDCSGFTSFVLKQFDVKVSPASAAQSKEGVPVSLNAVQPGDLIIFGRNSKDIQHVALVVERTRDGIICVHSTTSRGVIKENVTTSAYWKPLILGARDVVTPSGRRREN